MRILIFGGSFNPPHLGHIRSVQTAAAALGPEKIFLIPASVPPHKELDPDSPSAAERLRMTALAAAMIPGAEALDIELRREGKSYTADTVCELKARYPDDELIFLLGTDMLITFPTWHEPETIAANASIAVFSREKGRQAEIERAADILRDRYGATVYVIPGEPVEASSTAIRALLRARGGAELLPGEVYAHIIQKRLYGAKPDFEWLRREAYAYLAPKRVAHVRGVEQEALRLAERWGADPGEAAEAAICHDITKRLDHDEQLRLCEKYAIMTDELERASEKLLHAKTGAALASALFGLSTDTAIAIRFHTTGRPGMTTLEMITYLADYIEPGREGFAGLKELRKACYEDLDRAMELALRMSLDEVRGKGSPAHINSVSGHAWYLNNLRRRGLAPVRAEGIPDTVG